jgi:signal transduction histidine kinase
VLSTLLFVMAILGALLGWLVLRAAPERWDNRFFAACVFVDSLMSASRSGLIAAGYRLGDIECLRTCAILSVVTAYLSLEFACAFPSGRRAPPRLRWPVMLWTLGALALMLHDQGFVWFSTRANNLYFLPLCLITLTVLWKSWRKVQAGVRDAGIPLVMAALAFRWTSAMVPHTVGRSMGHDVFSTMLELDATISIFLGYLLFGYAVLRFNLFRVRGVVADIVLQGGFVVATVGLVAGGVNAALRLPDGAAQRFALVSVALVPVLLVSLARWLKPRVEEALLSPIDPRRALAKVLLARVARAAEREVRPAAMIALTSSALEELTGGRVRFLRSSALEEPTAGAGPEASPTSSSHQEVRPALAEHLLAMDGPQLVRARDGNLEGDVATDLDQTPGDVLVAVRRGGHLYGALALDGGGQLDRGLLTTAVSMAEHLAMKLENISLFSQTLALRSELDESRRLASLGAFAAAIAHDIRTPLTSVQMNVQILRGKVQLPPDDMEYFDIALDELKRLNASVQEILDYAKPVDLRATAVELSGVAGEAARRIAPLLEERHVSLETHLDSELPPVLADAQRIRQVLINLLDNAAQASNEGCSIQVSTRIADGGRIAVDVADSGKGIRSEDLSKIFEPFFTTRPDGTGLGLAIAQKLVRAHGGEIRVDSTVGKGSTFTVLLPQAPAAA